MSKLSKEAIIGIDLGTTNSVVCVYDWNQKKPKVVMNKLGQECTPSTVFFDPVSEQILVGQQAVEKMLTKYAANTVYAAKRFMGKKFTDTTVQKDKYTLEFNIDQGTGPNAGYPTIQIPHNGKGVEMMPEEIGAKVLGSLMQDAQKVLAEELEDISTLHCVISVPAYFTNEQKQATIKAGEMIGLKVETVVSEPTAAALSYGLDKAKSDQDRTICVFDLGGGTFDVSIVTISGEKPGQQQEYKVLAVGGDAHLGGEDFDNVLFDYAANQFDSEHADDGDGLAIRKIPNAKFKLKHACKTCKEQLAAATEYTIDLPAILAGHDFNMTITRDKFYELCAPVFARCMPHLEKTLLDAGKSKDQIDAVIPVGGSCRILAIQQLIQDFFGGKERIDKKLEFDTSIAFGACIQCLTKVAPEYGPKIEDIIPFAIGVAIDKVPGPGKKFYQMIERMSQRGASFTAGFQTNEDNQDHFDVEVYEGIHDANIEDCTKLGKFVCQPIEKKPKGEMVISIKIETDQSGCTQVSAITCKKEDHGQVSPPSAVNLTIDSLDGRLSAQQKEDALKVLHTEVTSLRTEITNRCNQILTTTNVRSGHKTYVQETALVDVRTTTNVPGLKEILAKLDQHLKSY